MKNKTTTLSYIFVLFILFLIRIYGLNEIGLAEYDSVFNFQIVQAMSQGDWQHLFQHGSPTFFIFFYCFYQLFPSYLFLEYVNCLVSLFAVAYFVHTLAKASHYEPLKEILLLIFSGFSVFLVYSTRSFAIESLSLLCFALLFRQLLVTYQTDKDVFFTANNYLFWWIFTIFLTINYKILLILPILFLLVLLKIFAYQTPKNILYFLYQSKKIVANISIILLLPFALYTLIGVLLGLKWTAYIGHWVYVLVLRKNLNAWKPTYTFHTDIDFYFQYLAHYENIVLLFGLLLAIYYLYQYLKRFENIISKNNIFFISSLFVVFTFALMSFLPKAPRALLFILPLLYFLTFHFCVIVLDKIIQQKKATYLLACFVLLNVLLQSYYLHEYIYRFTKTSYPLIANYLEQKKINKIAVTVSLNIYPFLPEHITMKQILYAKELENLQAMGYEYCLIDDFTKIVGATGFENVATEYTTVLAVPEPTLIAPIVYFEHCEFNSYTFEEAQKVQKKMNEQSQHLRLVRLQKK
ncbi:MAG: hypothetical protein ACOVQA_12245 [Thermoflexibacteraceae bacterium]